MTNHDTAIWNPALGQMKLTKRAGKGDEYVGACPDCGGKDRFHIWPSDGETGRFWCRKCDRKGDGIDYLRWQHNMSFQQACEVTGKQTTRRRTIRVNTSWWKVPQTTTSHIPEGPISPVEQPTEPALNQEYQLVSWYPENHIEMLGCGKCCFRHDGYCSTHPRNSFVNIRCIDECPRPNKGSRQ